MVSGGFRVSGLRVFFPTLAQSSSSRQLRASDLVPFSEQSSYLKPSPMTLT